MRVEAQHPRVRVDVLQQFPHAPCVFGGHEIRGPQHVGGARCEISEMTEGRGDDGERARRHQETGHGSRW